MTADIEQTRQFSIEIVRKLKSAGFQALWAGGCVRDLLLGKPSKDFDVATNAAPDQVRKLFGHKRTLPIGASFGVITVLGGRQRGQVEVATFRTDMGYSDGRRPDDVRFSSAEEDAQRRDFTINGMFYDPVEQKVLDFVGGQRDLKARLVRSIGNPYRRFEEDKLRMLRAVRFTSTFGFEMQLETHHAICQYARHIHVVSAERIAAEMRRMLAHENRMQAVRMLRDLKLLEQLLPELSPLVGHAPRWRETYRALEYLQLPDFRAAMACLLRMACLRDIALKPRQGVIQPAAAICQRWKLTTEETKTIQWLLRNEKTVRQADQVAWPQLQRLLIDPAAPLLLSVADSHVRAQGATERGVKHARACLSFPPQKLNPPPLLSGRDLIRAGLKPGPRFQQVLDAVRDAQLEQQIHTPAEALELAQRLWGNT